MLQRASLCRALVHEPQLLMLDEPFGALDQFTREELWAVMQELWMKLRPTVLLVTHDLKEAGYLANRICVMRTRPGQIIDDAEVPFPRPRTIDMSYLPEFVSHDAAAARIDRVRAAGEGDRVHEHRSSTATSASTAFIIGFFLLWEAPAGCSHVSDIVLPKPSQIIVTLVERMPALWPHTVQTLYTTLVGFAFGIVIGILLGVLIGSSRLAYDVAYPLLVGFASIPKVAVVPIFVLWFGAGTVPAILTAMIMSIFPDRGERRDRTCHHRARARGRDARAAREQARHSLERRPAAHHALFLRLAESRGHARLRRHRDLGNGRVQPRHRQCDDDRLSSNFDVPLVFAGLLILASWASRSTRSSPSSNPHHRMGASQGRICDGLMPVGVRRLQWRTPCLSHAVAA